MDKYIVSVSQIEDFLCKCLNVKDDNQKHIYLNVMELAKELMSDPVDDSINERHEEVIDLIQLREAELYLKKLNKDIEKYCEKLSENDREKQTSNRNKCCPIKEDTIEMSIKGLSIDETLELTHLVRTYGPSKNPNITYRGGNLMDFFGKYNKMNESPQQKELREFCSMRSKDDDEHDGVPC